MSKPKWVTPERQAELIKLFLQSNGFCIYGHSPCMGKWERKTVTVCSWGKCCSSPMENGKPCRYPPEDGKPQLPCEAYHAIKLNWHCAYGDYPSYKPYECHYEIVQSRLIREWAQDSRSQTNAKWQRERQVLHALGEPRTPIRGRFSGLTREIVLDNQPAYYLEGLGISGLTFKPFAEVRIASSYMHLFIDIGSSLNSVSKNKKRKAIRYGKPLPARVLDGIDLECNKAVRHYLKR